MIRIPLFVFALLLNAACATNHSEIEVNISTQPPGKAHGSNARFRYRLETQASPKEIWDRWMDVANWKAWDLGLKDARSAPLALNVVGTIVPHSGPKSKFTVTEFNESEFLYAFQNKLPGGMLTVRRSIVGKAPTIIQHEIVFTGLTGWLFAQAMGSSFRKALPETMHKLVSLAEGAE